MLHWTNLVCWQLPWANSHLRSQSCQNRPPAPVMMTWHLATRETDTVTSHQMGDGREWPHIKHQRLCTRCNLKFCQVDRLCVAYTQNCGKMGHFEKCCCQPTNYFNAKHWRWLPTHKMGRPQLTKPASVLSRGTSSNGGKSIKTKIRLHPLQKKPKKQKQSKNREK